MRLSEWGKKLLETSKKDFFLLSFISLNLFSFWLNRQPLFLSQVKNGIIGIATLEKTDVNARVLLFYKSLFLIVLIFFLLCFSWNFIRKKISLSRNILIVINYLAGTGTLLIILNLMLSNNKYAVNFFAGLIAFLFTIDLIQNKFFRKYKSYLNTKTLLYVLFLSFSLSISFSAFLHCIKPQAGISLEILFFPLAAFLIFILRLLNLSKKKFGELIFLSRSVFFLPLTYFITAETYLILNQRGYHSLSPWLIFVFFTIPLLVYTLFLFNQKKANHSFWKEANYFIIPTCLSAFVLYIYYHPVITQSEDLFELANQANALMRTLDFKEVPLLQAFSSHLMYDQVPGFLYFFLNGYNGSLDFLIYQSLLPVLYLLIIYYFLLKIFNNGITAFTIIVFFPFLDFILPQDYSLTLVTILLLHKLLKEYSFKILLLTCFYSFLLLLWRIDLGLANGLTACFVLVFYLITNFTTRLLKDYLLALSFLIVPVILLTAVLTFSFNIDITTNLKQALDYIGASQAHGYSQVSYEQNKYYYLHYFLFPLLCLGILIYLVIKRDRFASNKKQSFIYLSLLFLIVFYFANAQRGIVRHSLIEQQDGFISSFFFFIVPAFLVFIVFEGLRWKFYSFLLICSIFIVSFKLPYGFQENLFHQFRFAFKGPSLVQPTSEIILSIIPNKYFYNKNFM
jgi:hypothetical protein